MIPEILEKSIVFSSLTSRERSAISTYFEQLRFRKNETIFHEGDPSDWFCLVAAGEVKILKHSVQGRDIILEIMSPGDIFGGVAVLDHKPFPATAEALETATIIRISRPNLLRILEEYPILKLEVVKYFSDKLRDAHEMLKKMATERVEKRIASLLLKLSEKVGVTERGLTKITFPLTRQDIAEMVGTTGETCIRTMSKFQKMDIVKSSKNRILIRVEALQKYLDDERMASPSARTSKVFLINSSFCGTISSASPWTGAVRFVDLDVMDVTDMVT